MMNRECALTVSPHHISCIQRRSLRIGKKNQVKSDWRRGQVQWRSVREWHSCCTMLPCFEESLSQPCLVRTAHIFLIFHLIFKYYWSVRQCQVKGIYIIDLCGRPPALCTDMTIISLHIKFFILYSQWQEASMELKIDYTNKQQMIWIKMGIRKSKCEMMRILYTNIGKPCLNW